MSETHYDTIVIGAGANGLTAAARAAGAARRVLVVEARSHVGGLAVAPTIAGCTAPGPLHDTTVVSDVVVKALCLEAHGLERTIAPPVLGLEADGPGILIETDPRRAYHEIEKRSPDDARAYARYRETIDRYGEILKRVLTAVPPEALSLDPSTLMTMAGHGLALRRLGRDRMADLLRVMPMCSADWLNEFFTDDLLKATLAGPSIDGTFTGPWSPGNNGCLLRHGALAGRAVMGGPIALIDALQNAATESGVEIRCSTRVGSITIEDNRVRGVVLEDGTQLTTSQIIATCDPKQLFLRLVAPAHLPRSFVQRVEQFRATGHCALLVLAMREPLRYRGRADDLIVHARTGETFDHLEHAFDAVKYGQWSATPALRIMQYETEVGDAGAVASVLVQYAPYDLRDGWNDARREELARVTLSELARYVDNLDETVMEHRMLCPVDIQTEFGTTGGHIHHGEHGLDQMIVRPTPECARYATPVRGLRLGGSGAHPGGELTCLPGYLSV